MDNIFNWGKKIVYFIAWKACALMCGVFVFADWVAYKRNPIQENRTRYLGKRNWWIRQLQA